MSLSLHEAVLAYVAALHAEGTPISTVRSYKSVLLRLCQRYPGRQYGGIATKDLAGFLYGPEGITTGKSAGTGTTYRSGLRSFFRYGQLMGWGKEVSVPTPVIRQRGGSQRSCRPTRLTSGQMALMLSEASTDPVLRCILAVSMNTALRISDVRKIRIGEVDLQAGEILVWVQKTQRFDALPVTSDLESELRGYLRWYTEATGRTVRDADAFLFPGRQRVGSDGFSAIRYDWTTDRHVSSSTTHDKIVELYRRSGISVEPGEAWHVIRRSVARIYFDGLKEMSHDHALRQTAALLGHLNASTTEKYLGMAAEVEARNESMRGKPFLRPAEADVIPISRAW